MRRAFTLMEVNLAILIMAGGILSVVSLYSLGFRESRQSTEDVASAAYADAVVSPLVMALSATNVTWEQFRDLRNYPGDNGWFEYLNNSTWLVDGNPEGKARPAFDNVMSKLGNSDFAWPADSGGLVAGLVVMHDPGSAVVSISFRASKLPSMLMSAPLYYTEVRFQGEVPHASEED